MTLVLLNISPYPPSQALLFVASVAVFAVILIYTRSRKELWARRIKQASMFNGLIAVGIIAFWITYWFSDPRFLPFVHFLEEFGVMASFAAVAWHVGTNLVFSGDKYFFTVLCKSCSILFGVGVLIAAILGIQHGFPMMGVRPLPVEAFTYRAALLIPGIFATLLIFVGFASEYLFEAKADHKRKRRQFWFGAGSLIWLVIVCGHLGFSYLNVFRYELLTTPTVFRAVIGVEFMLYILMAVTWIRAITLDIAQKSDVQQQMEADLRRLVHEISRRRRFFDLADLYPDWADRAEKLLLAVKLHSIRRGCDEQLETALAAFADVHLCHAQRSFRLPQRVSDLVDEQRREISEVSALSSVSVEDRDVVDVMVGGYESVDLVAEPPHMQLAMVAAAYEDLLSVEQSVGILDGKLVDPYLVKVYRVAMDGIPTRTETV